MSKWNDYEIKRLEDEIHEAYYHYFYDHFDELTDCGYGDYIEHIEEPKGITAKIEITMAEGIEVWFTFTAKHYVYPRSKCGEPVEVIVESSKKAIPEIAESLFVSLQIKLEAFGPKDHDDIIFEIERDLLAEREAGR